MKKIGYILLPFTLFIALFIYFENADKLIDIPLEGSHAVYGFSDLENKADIIALVEIKDDLSKNNSTILYHENSPFIQYHYSTRKAKVLKFYKNALGLKNSIEFIEPATAITANNEYLHLEGYDTFKKGRKYIIYLTTNKIGELYLISNNNGKVNLEDFSYNEYKEIAVKSILRADGIMLDKATKLHFDVPYQNKVSNFKDKNKIKEKKIKIEGLNITLKYYYDNINKLEYINVQGVDFYINRKLYSE